MDASVLQVERGTMNPEKEASRAFALKSWRNLAEKAKQSMLLGLKKTVDSLDGDNRIFAFWPILSSEPDIREILLQFRGTVYIPALMGDKTLRFRLFPGVDALIRNSAGSYEPTPDQPEAQFPPLPGDLILIPALGVNRDGVRLGRGGGFYDRTRDYLSGGVRISLVPDELSHLDFPSEDHDLRLNRIITQSKTVDY